MAEAEQHATGAFGKGIRGAVVGMPTDTLTKKHLYGQVQGQHMRDRARFSGDAALQDQPGCCPKRPYTGAHQKVKESNNLSCSCCT